MLFDFHGNVVKENILQKKQIILYGASTRNKKMIEELEIQNDIAFVVDSNNTGGTIDGYQVMEPCEIKRMHNCIVLSVLVKYAQEINDNVKQNNCEECYFYQPEFSDASKIINNNLSILTENRTFKVLHIFPAAIFVKLFYEMTEDCFDITENLFIIDYYLKDDIYNLEDFLENKCESNKNIMILDDNSVFFANKKEEYGLSKIFEEENMKCILSRTSKIVLHSTFWSNRGQNLVKDLVQQMGKKMVWYAWGGDIYYDENFFEVQHIFKKIGQAYAPKSGVNYIAKKYNVSFCTTGATYAYIPKNPTTFENICNNGRGINILLGHSAAEYSNHEYGFNAIEKYKEQNIHIYCPLSYGSIKYRNKIIRLGDKLFGSKFIPLIDFMDTNQYYNFLQTMDVAVFPMNRHAAGTTISYLHAIGKKIYLTTEMVQTFILNNIDTESIDRIKDQTFDQFIENPTRIRDTQERINNHNRNIVNEWEKILT